MLTLDTTARYRRDRKLMAKRGKDMELLNRVIQMLLEQKPLPAKYNDHPLTGDYAGFRDCHIQNDWVLIYAVDNDRLILTASRTGTHADVF